MLCKVIILLFSILTIYSQDIELTSQELIPLINNKNTRKSILKKIDQDLLFQGKVRQLQDVDKIIACIGNLLVSEDQEIKVYAFKFFQNIKYGASITKNGIRFADILNGKHAVYKNTVTFPYLKNALIHHAFKDKSIGWLRNYLSLIRQIFWFERDERFLSVFEKIFYYKSQNEKRHEWEDMEYFYRTLVGLISVFPKAHLILKRLFDNAKNMDTYGNGLVRYFGLSEICFSLSDLPEGKKVLNDILENWSHEKMLSVCGNEERVHQVKETVLYCYCTFE